MSTEIKATSSIAIIDTADIGYLSSYLSCNLPTMQAESLRSNPISYTPDWSTTPLVLSPTIFLNNTALALSNPNLVITWKRKEGDGSETILTDGESVFNGALTVNKNKLPSIASGSLTYTCTITYNDPVIKESITSISSLTFSLIRYSEKSAFCSISGESFMLFDRNEELLEPISGIITLNAMVMNVDIEKWQYKKQDGTFADYPVTTHNSSINSHTLNIGVEDTVFFNNATVIKLVTNDPNVYDLFTITKIRDNTGFVPVTSVLSNESHTLSANSDGVVSSYSGAESTIYIYEDNQETTNTWNISVYKSDGIAGEQSVDKKTFTVTGMSVDSGFVRFTATKADYPDIVKVFSLNKNKSGTDARIFVLSSNTLVLNRTTNGVFLPSSVTFDAYYRNGSSATRLPYNGIFVIYESVDGSNYVEKYRSLTNESSKAYTPSSILITDIRCELYSPENVLLDAGSVVITSDGTDGLSVIVGNEFVNIPCTAAGLVSPPMIIEIPFCAFKGTSKIACSATVDSLPAGMTINTITSSSPEADGLIKIDVANEATLGNTNTGAFQIRFTAENATVVRPVSWSKNKASINGEDAINHQVLSLNGNVLTSNIASVTLKSIMYKGSSEITQNISYIWSKLNSFGAWENTDITTQTIDISRDMVNGSATFKCEATFEGTAYVALFSVFDKYDTYSANIISTIGSTILNGEGEGILYTKLYKNGVEIDPLKTEDFVFSLPTTAPEGKYVYFIERASGVVTLKKYGSGIWYNYIEEGTPAYNYFRTDYKGNSIDDGTPWKTGKVVYFTGEDLESKSTTINVFVNGTSNFLSIVKLYDSIFQNKCEGHTSRIHFTDHTDNAVIVATEIKGETDFGKIGGFDIVTVGKNLFDKTSTTLENGTTWSNPVLIPPKTKYFTSHSNTWRVYSPITSQTTTITTSNVLDGIYNDSDSLWVANVKVEELSAETMWISNDVLFNYEAFQTNVFHVDYPLLRMSDTVYDSFVCSEDMETAKIIKRVGVDVNGTLFALGTPIETPVQITTNNNIKSFNRNTFLYVIDDNSFTTGIIAESTIICKSESWFNYYMLNHKFDNIVDVVFAAIEDDIISISESYTIQENLYNLVSEKSIKDVEYNQIISNTFLKNTTDYAFKDILISTKNMYNTKYNELKNIIDIIVASDKVSSTDVETMRVKFDAYSLALKNLILEMQKSNDFITGNKIDTVNISARNLLRNSDFKNVTLNPWDYNKRGTGPSPIVDTTTTYRGHNTLKLDYTVAGSDSNDNRFQLFGLMGYEAGAVESKGSLQGKNITLGFWAKSINCSTIRFRHGYVTYTDINSITLTTEWAYYTVQSNTSISLELNAELFLYADKVDTIWMTEIMIVRGDKVPDWTPAPEDIYAGLDSKNTVYTVQPTPPYIVGDLWVEGSSGDIKRCTTARSTGSYTASDWTLASKYTDNTKVNSLQSTGLKVKANYSTFSTVNAGELYLHGFNDTTGADSDVNGWVMWNDSKITIPKVMVDPNTICPFNVPLYVVRRIVAGSTTSGTTYIVWYQTSDKTWKYTSTTASTVNNWLWVTTTDIILCSFISPGSEQNLHSVITHTPCLNSSDVIQLTDSFAISSMVKKWTDNAVGDTTEILGGWIKTNTITADKLVFGINGNLVTGGYDTFDSVPNSEEVGIGTNCTLSLVSSPCLYGSKSLKVTTNTGGYSLWNVGIGTVQRDLGLISIIPGKIYRISCYVQSPVNNALAGLTIDRYFSDKTRSSSSTQPSGTPSYSELYKYTGTIANEWKRIEFTYLASAEYSYLRLGISGDNEISSNTYGVFDLYFCGFQVEEVETGSQLAGPFKPAALTFIDASRIITPNLSAISANLGTVTAGIIQSQNYNDNTMTPVDENGQPYEGYTVLTGTKIDLNNPGFYTPQITMKDNFLRIDGYQTIGKRYSGIIGTYSLTVGYGNIASGRYSYATGYATEAKGIGSHAEGYFSRAEGDYSHAEGRDKYAYGDYSHAEGAHGSAQGVAAHSEGNSTSANGDASHAEGINTQASGNYSHAEGMAAFATSIASHAEGASTTASGSYSHAEGIGTTASGSYSHAEGGSNTAYGDYSHAEGYQTLASGMYSHAEGLNSTASGMCSHASGFLTVAGYDSQFVIGQYNINKATNVFEVGYGTSESNRANILELDFYGDLYISRTIYENNKKLSDKYITYTYSDVYPGVNIPDAKSSWLRSPTAGFLGHTAGISSLGTSSWKWNQVHAISIFEDGASLESKYAQFTTVNGHPALYSSTGYIRSASTAFLPYTPNSTNLGLSTSRWNQIHGVTIYENGTSLSNKYLQYRMDTNNPNGNYNGINVNGSEEAWVRTTSMGILPYKPGTSKLGTSSWKFEEVNANSVIANNMRPLAIYISHTDPRIEFFYNNSAEWTSRIRGWNIYTTSLTQFNSARTISKTIDFLVESGGRGIFRPSVDNDSMVLGSSTYRWTQLFTTTAPSVTSDRKEKIDKGAITRSKELIMGLDPRFYQYIKGESGRIHMGFYAQDIEKTMHSIGMVDCAVYTKDVKPLEYTRDGEIYPEGVTRDNAEDSQLIYGLRYEELIAPTVGVVQEHEYHLINVDNQISSIFTNLSLKDLKIMQLEEKVDSLQNEVTLLKAMLNV